MGFLGKSRFFSFLIIMSSNLSAVQGNLQSSSGFVASSVGGATVAQFVNEFDAVIDNPALMQMTKTKKGTHKYMVGLEYARYPNDFAVNTDQYTKGEEDLAWIPFVGYFYNINEDWKFGTGIFGVGGTGYDYSNSQYLGEGLYAAISIPLAFSYRVTEEFNVGASLNLVVAQLDTNNNSFGDKRTTAITFTPAVGASYTFMHNITVGANISMGTTATYKDHYIAVQNGTAMDMKIGIPAQYSLGVAYNGRNYSFGFKYRFVDWEHAENYKQLDWKNQHTYSIGGQYKMNPYIFRAGIYHVSSVYSETDGVNGDEMITFQGAPLSKYFRDFANALIYGAPQWQYAIGLGYELNKKMLLDFGFIYEPEATMNFSGTIAVGGDYEIRKKNSNMQIFLTFTQEI